MAENDEDYISYITANIEHLEKNIGNKASPTMLKELKEFKKEVLHSIRHEGGPNPAFIDRYNKKLHRLNSLISQQGPHKNNVGGSRRGRKTHKRRKTTHKRRKTKTHKRRKTKTHKRRK